MNRYIFCRSALFIMHQVSVVLDKRARVEVMQDKNEKDTR